MPSSVAAVEPPIATDLRTIGLVGLAHATSHFFQLLMPLLFPWLAKDFALSYAQLGSVVSVFFVVSAIGQALAGFLVDRVGARPVLFGALALFATAACALAGDRATRVWCWWRCWLVWAMRRSIRLTSPS